jgi:hypothetical protein
MSYVSQLDPHPPTGPDARKGRPGHGARRRRSHHEHSFAACDLDNAIPPLPAPLHMTLQGAGPANRKPLCGRR